MRQAVLFGFLFVAFMAFVVQAQEEATTETASAKPDPSEGGKGKMGGCMKQCGTVKKECQDKCDKSDKDCKKGCKEPMKTCRQECKKQKKAGKKDKKGKNSKENSSGEE